MSSLKMMKQIYDKLKNDKLRSMVLTAVEYLGMRKDIIRFDTNNYCNIKCIMCNRHDPNVPKHFISFDKYKNLLQVFAKKTKILYLSCAYEPLATPQFNKYLTYAKSLRIPFISFCTNGLLLNREMIKCLVDKQIDEIIISFNGYTKDDYNRIMKGSEFDRVYKNLKKLNAYKKYRNSAKPQIRFNTMLMKSNLENAHHLEKIVSELGISSIQFRELVLYENQNDPKALQDELIVYHSKDEYDNSMKTILNTTDKLRKNGIEVILPIRCWSESECNDNSNHQLKKQTNTQKHTCSIPFFSYWIDCFGNVNVCGYDKNGMVGNVLSQDKKSLQRKRKDFQKLCLAGECSKELCTMNIDSSTIK